MAVRSGQNLLEEALRVATATRRSHPARLTCLLRLAARTYGLASATLFLPDHQKKNLTRRYGSELAPAGTRCLIPFGSGLAGGAALTLTQHTALHRELHPEEATTREAERYLSFPLLNGRELAAVVSLSGTAQTLTPACAGLRPLLPLFLGLVGSLYQEEAAERDRRRLALVSAVANLLSAPLPPGQLLTRFLRLVTGGGLAVCAVARLEADDKGKPRLFRVCRSEARLGVEGLLTREQSLALRVLASEASCSEEAPPGDPSRFCAFGTPLGSNGKTLGTLCLFAPGEVLAPEHIGFLETLARLVASALAESVSSERITSFLEENEKKLKELSLLYRMSNTMLSTIKLNKLIHLTLTALTSAPTSLFDRAMLFLSNERSGVLQGMLGVTCESAPVLASPRNGGNDLFSSRWDISEEAMAAQRDSEFNRQVLGKRLELDATRNIASQAILERRLIYVPGELEEEPDELHPGHGTAYAASPLIAHGQAVGAVLVDNALSRAPITQEDLRFLQLFANQAGMAIENSILYNKVEDANRQISEAQESLLQKERLAAIGEMAAGIAHELKGPLVSIGGFAARLTRKLPPDTSEWSCADLIVREVLRLESVLSEILHYSKRPTICYTCCNLNDIVKESLAVVAPQIEEKEIEATTRYSRKKLGLQGDCQQLKQVFINLLLNSLDAMDKGGKLAVVVAPDRLDGKEAVCVRIADTGGGIPVEALANIFTPFYTTKENGTGLGLPIANRIITNHGGKIQLFNKPGFGAEFKILLPMEG